MVRRLEMSNSREKARRSREKSRENRDRFVDRARRCACEVAKLDLFAQVSVNAEATQITKEKERGETNIQTESKMYAV
jgi:hypothetical protein